MESSNSNKVVVAQGQHLAAILRSQGRESFAKTWNDPANVALRQRRETPHALLPGDEVTIPDRKPYVYRKATGKSYTFTVTLMPLKLRLKVLDEFGEPVASTGGTLQTSASQEEVSTDGDGSVEITIDNDITSATLTLGDRSYSLAVGHLDPIDEISGQLGRLHALGYFDAQVPDAADFDAQDSAIEAEMQLAWELFQDANGLRPTGTADDTTVSKLKEAFGG